MRTKGSVKEVEIVQMFTLKVFVKVIENMAGVQTKKTVTLDIQKKIVSNGNRVEVV